MPCRPGDQHEEPTIPHCSRARRAGGKDDGSHAPNPAVGPHDPPPRRGCARGTHEQPGVAALLPLARIGFLNAPQEREANALAKAVSTDARSGQFGVGPVEQGLPFNWTNANTRFATRVTVEGVDIPITSRPTAGGVITAYPVGGGDPANLLIAVPPYGATPGVEDLEP